MKQNKGKVKNAHYPERRDVCFFLYFFLKQLCAYNCIGARGRLGNKAKQTKPMASLPVRLNHCPCALPERRDALTAAALRRLPHDYIHSILYTRETNNPRRELDAPCIVAASPRILVANVLDAALRHPCNFKMRARLVPPETTTDPPNLHVDLHVSLCTRGGHVYELGDELGDHHDHEHAGLILAVATRPLWTMPLWKFDGRECKEFHEKLKRREWELLLETAQAALAYGFCVHVPDVRLWKGHDDPDRLRDDPNIAGPRTSQQHALHARGFRVRCDPWFCDEARHRKQVEAELEAGTGGLGADGRWHAPLCQLHTLMASGNVWLKCAPAPLSQAKLATRKRAAGLSLLFGGAVASSSSSSSATSPSPRAASDDFEPRRSKRLKTKAWRKHD